MTTAVLADDEPITLKFETVRALILSIGLALLFSTQTHAADGEKLYLLMIDGNCTEPLAALNTQAEAGDAESQFSLAHAYRRGLCVPQSDKQWISWLSKAAEKGHIASRFNLAISYEFGAGADKDEKRALTLYRGIAEHGVGVGQFNMGRMYENGLGGLEKDDRQAVEWYRKAAEQGVPNAQVSLARMYEAGRGGLKKDVNRAEVLRNKAAYRRDCKSSCNDFCEFARPGAPLLSALLCMASPGTPSKR